METKRFNLKYISGFTLVELIVVILLIGIISISIAPRFFGVSSFESRRAADEALSAIKHAQQIAMARTDQIHFVLTANDYTVQISGADIDPNIPDLRSPEGLSPYQRRFNGVTATAATVRFNGLGQPVDSSGDPLPSDLDLNIGSGITIRIEANTGYAHIL